MAFASSLASYTRRPASKSASCLTLVAASAALASSKIVKNSFPTLTIRIPSEIRNFRIHHDHIHPVAQVHISRQRHHLPFLQPAHHLITCRVRDAHMDLPLLQYRFTHAQLVFLHHEHVPPPALGLHRSARHRQHAEPFPRIDSHIYIRVWQQLQLVIVHRTQQFANASRSARHHLFRNNFRFPCPAPVRQRIPGNFHRLVCFQRAQFWLVDKRPDPNLVQVRHLRPQLPQLYEISFLRRLRIERPIHGRRNPPIPYLVLKRRHFVLRLLHLQRRALRIQPHPAVKLLLRRCQPRHLRLRFS